MVTTTLSRTQNMSLLVALDDEGAAIGDLYWDDGEARDVGENYYMLLFNCSAVSKINLLTSATYLYLINK